MGDNRNKSGKKAAIKTSGRFAILDDELGDDAAVPTGLANQAIPPIKPSSNISEGPLPLPQLTEQLKAVTANFELTMREAMKSMLDSIKEVQKTLEFEGRRISELEKKNSDLERRLEKVEKNNQELERRVRSQDLEANLVDRLSKRDNFRVVGYKEHAHKDGESESEDCVRIVEDILKSKFKLDIQVESAYRAGKKGEKPRHIVVKTRSHQDKVSVMKDARTALQKEDIYVIDDLTRRDLEEKRRYKNDVQELYAKGIKLRFFAGHWRGSGGAPYFSA